MLPEDSPADAERSWTARVDAWRAEPDAAGAIAICTAVTPADADEVRPLAIEFAREALTAHSEVGALHMAVARMLLIVEALEEAQSTLSVAAGVLPDDPRVYALLGQTLLRLGDARRAVAAFDEAAARGVVGPATQLLSERARVYVRMQDEAGEDAVADEVRRELCSVPPARPTSASDQPPSTQPAPVGPVESIPEDPRVSTGGLRWQPGAPAGGAVAKPRRRREAVRTLMGLGRTDGSAPQTVEEVLAAIAEQTEERDGSPSDTPGPLSDDSAPPPRLPSDVPYANVARRRGRDGDRSPGASGQRPGTLSDGDEERPVRVAAREQPFDGDVRRAEHGTRYSVIGSGRQESTGVSRPTGRRPGPDENVPSGRGGSTRISDRPGRPATTPGQHRDFSAETWAQANAARVEWEDPDDAETQPPREVDTAALQRAAKAARPKPAAGAPPPAQRAEPEVAEREPSATNGAGSAVTSDSERPAPQPSSHPALGSEPPRAVPRSVRPAAPRRRWKRWALPIGLAVCVVVGLQAGRWLEQGRGHQATARLVEQALAAVHTGDPAALAEADALLRKARDADAKSLDVALATVHTRMVRALDGDERAGALSEAVAEARRLGASPHEVAAGEIVVALDAGDDARVQVLLAEHDAAGDRGLAATAFYDLAAGAAMDRRGDPRSVDRYQSAVRADPSLLPAELRLVRAMLLVGDANEGRRRARALPPGRVETSVLAALAARVADGDSAQLAPIPPDQLPRSLRSLARALELRGRAAGDGAAFAAAIEAADAPSVALFCGRRALDAGEAEAAELAGRRALQLAPGYGPAHVLVGRAGFARGDLLQLRAAADQLKGIEGAELRAIHAYETGAHAELESIVAAIQPPPAAGAPMRVALERSRGAPIAAAPLTAAAKADPLWGTMVAMDAALDAGDLRRAREISVQWQHAPRHPLNARREARLLRYEGRLDEARRALDAAAPTALALHERALLAGELRSERSATMKALEASNLPQKKWLVAYIWTRADQKERAKLMTTRIDFPPEAASIEERIAALVTLGELVSDKKGRVEAKRLFAQWPENLDLLRAAVGFGFVRKSALNARRR
jgi:hypothetical protein